MGMIYEIPHLPMLGKGSILFDRFAADGSSQGYVHLGNCTKFELQLKDERADLYQHINAAPSLIATALKKRDVILAITGTDFNSDHMALAMMATGKTPLVVSVATIVGEALVGATPTKKGKYFQTVNKNIDPATVVVHQSGAPLVLGTDYHIADAVQGLIYFTVGGATSDAVLITIDYHTLSATYDQVNGATQPFVLGKIRFVPDPTDGQKIGVEVWRTHLSPNGQIGLIADDYGNWTLDALALDDTANHATAPYFQATFY